MTADTDSPGPVPAMDLSAQDVVQLADELVAYHAEFAELFFAEELGYPDRYLFHFLGAFLVLYAELGIGCLIAVY